MKEFIIHSLFDTGVQLPRNAHDFEACLNDEDFLSVGATIYCLLKKQNKLQQTPDIFQESLKTKYTDVLYKNIFIKNQTLQILNEFEKQGIEVIPLKGPLFTEKYFGDIGARASSDIDLLIRKADVSRAGDCIKQLGYHNEKEELDQHFHCGFYKDIIHSPCPLAVELHWNIVKENTSNMDVNEFWSEATRFQSSYHYVKELSDYHAFYMICLHSWRHNLGSAKHYLDIMQMIRVLSYSLNFKKLIKEAEIHLTKKRLIKTLSIVYARFPFMTTLKKFPYQIYKSESFSTQETPFKRYINFMDYQFLSYDSVLHQFREFKNWVLPSQAEISILLNSKTKSKYLFSYFTLFKKRLLNLWKAL